MEVNGEKPPVGGGATSAMEDVDMMVEWLFPLEDDATELSKVLEASSEKTIPAKVKIIDDPCWHPLIFHTAASYITINCNEESCGSSFSDSDTSYMAGVSGGGCGYVIGDSGAWDGGMDEALGWVEAEGGGDCLVNGLTGG